MLSIKRKEDMLDEEVFKDLDSFMELGRVISKKHPELDKDLMDALFPLFKKYYTPRGIDPSGNAIH